MMNEIKSKKLSLTGFRQEKVKYVNWFLVLLLTTYYLLFSTHCLYAFFGKSGWTIFRKVRSAKFKAMTTTTGVRGDLSGVFYNPAVLGTNQQREIFFISERGFAEDKFGGLVYGAPLKNGMIAGGIVYYDAGKVDLYWSEGDGLMTESVIAQQDILGFLSYGHKFSDNFYSGLSVKIATSRLAEKKSAFAYCGDLGVFYFLTDKLGISAAVQNLGSSTKFIEKKNPLPASAYIGGGYMFRLPSNIYFLPSVDATYNLTDEKLIPETGIELGYSFVSINTGYKILKVGEANLHFGFGLNWKNIDFGYAFIPGSYLDPTHRLSVGYRFGSSGVSASEPTKTETPMAQPLEQPQNQTNFIYVKVKDAADNPLPNTMIKILWEGQELGKGVTDANGEYCSDDLLLDKYTVKALKDGYIAEEKEVVNPPSLRKSDTELTDEPPIEVKFTLRRK